MKINNILFVFFIAIILLTQSSCQTSNIPFENKPEEGETESEIITVSYESETEINTFSIKTTGTESKKSNDDIISELFAGKKSDVQVSGEGIVIRLLSDDDEGGRHQRFILELESGHTLLMAHNIDIAPRLDNLSVGDSVGFYGEYYYNDQGGGIHWTHRDPDKNHADGWLKLNGEIYQ